MPAMSEKGGPRLTRRQFLRTTASLIGAAALGADCAPASASPIPAPKPTELTIGPTATVPSQQGIEARLTPSTTPPLAQIKEPIPTPQPDGVNPASLNAESPVEASPAPEAEKEPQTLRELANRLGIYIGAIPSGQIFRPNQTPGAYENLMSREFNLLGVGIGWPNQRPEDTQSYIMPGSFFDRCATFATNYDQRFRCTALFWGNKQQLPRWLVEGNLSKEELIKIMQDRTRALMTHYKGKVHEWVVVNEAFHRNDGDFWAEKIGEEYVDIAFETARETDNSTILIYNDYGNETAGQVADMNTQQISRLRSTGIIDAIGEQMHITGERPPTMDALKTTMQRFKDLGVEVLVTELDVRLKNVPGTQEDRFTLQADVYRRVFEAALESGACKSITIQNPGDKYSWLEGSQVSFGGPNADPTPWDDDLNPKPAYYALKDVLQQTYAKRLANKT